MKSLDARVRAYAYKENEHGERCPPLFERQVNLRFRAGAIGRVEEGRHRCLTPKHLQLDPCRCKRGIGAPHPPQAQI